MNSLVRTRKHKNETGDTYACVMCGKTWKWSAKKIGHTEKTCAKYNLWGEKITR